MVNRIHKLSTQLANQIAAGEVVERPASIVKELVENSLDAKATSIHIFIEQGGLSCIKIQDNGAGIAQEDLLLAIAPHATSKIFTVQDLECIGSLGFRGEALASISAVSRFKLISKPHEQAYAFEVSLEGKETSPQQTVSPYPDGTTVIVRDLFFNVPARRKFLKNAQTEFLHIEDTVKRLALSHFNVEFSLYHNQKLIFKLPQADNEILKQQRLGKLFNQACLPFLRVLDFEHCGVSLKGWFADLNYTRSQADWQYIFINGRVVRDRLLNHAIRQAYQAKIYPGRQPVFALYLSLPGEDVDVNVHPTKHEVRFREQRFIHDFIISCLQQVFEEKSNATIQLDKPAQVKEFGNRVDAYWQSYAAPITNESSEPIKYRALLIENQWLLWPEEESVYVISLTYILEKLAEKSLREQQAKLLLYPWLYDLGQAEFHHINNLFTGLGCHVLLDDNQIKVTHIPHAMQSIYTQDNLRTLVAMAEAEVTLPLKSILKQWMEQLKPEALRSYLESQANFISQLIKEKGKVLRAAELASIMK